MRQNYKCPKCGQCVAKADKEEHEALHVDATCPYCKLGMELLSLEEHK
jgi:phage FluMu protein Com